ncbi:odorant receptor 2a [Fopius arisanus]|uniref:Odorant receptor n=1 Tax=Fopius arisanus TaxID=64838 RepID=A0A0C9RBR1_9HYME|nr:PREDICTED: odorant receptor 2a-like [Fopius arisanus]XP_011306605.1 PREDICTED: odorant receptor 2a-like [Fopius arisanus]
MISKLFELMERADLTIRFPQAFIEEKIMKSSDKEISHEGKDFNWEVGLIKTGLKLVGLWPKAAHQTFLFILNQLMQNYLLGVFLRSIILEPSVSRKINKIFVLTGIILTCVNHFIFRLQWCSVRPLIESIQRNWRDLEGSSKDIKDIMVLYGSLERRITRCICIAVGVSLVVFTLQPVILHLVLPSKFNLEHPSNPRHPFNATASPVFEIVYIIQGVFNCSAALIFASIDCCIIWMIFHCCGQLEVLEYMMKRFRGTRHHSSGSVDDDPVIVGCSCLQCIVHHHLQIFKIISLFDDAFHVTMLARIIVCTVHFTSIGYTIAKLREDGNFAFLLVHILFLLTMNSSLFVYCWVGDKLREKSANIADAAFNRYLFVNKEVSKDLIVIIRQTQVRPCHITAGKFFVMSLHLFKEYIFKSISYLSVVIALRFNDKY